MATLTNLSISMNLNAAGVKSGSILARNEIGKLQKAINAQKTELESTNEKLGLYAKALRAGALTRAQYDELIRRAAADQVKLNIANREAIENERKKAHAMAVATQEANRQKTAMASLAAANMRVKEAAMLTAEAEALQAKSMSGLAAIGGKLIGVFAAIGFTRMAKEAVTLAADFETMQIQFEVLLGSATKATAAINTMRKFAAASPLTLNAVTSGVKTMIAFGMESERAMKAMQMLGDISLGNAEKFGSLTLAFGQVNAAGRLMGQEVLQFVNAGFNPLQEIARTTGISMRQLKQDMEAGKISADMVFGALESATAEGGRFNSMTERLATTTSGQLAQSLDQLQRLGVAMGKELIPPLKDILEIFRDMNESSEGPIWFIGKLAEGLRLVTGAYKDSGSVLQGFALSAQGLGEAFKGNFAEWRRLEAEGKSMVWAGLGHTATSAALNKTIAQSDMRAQEIKDKAALAAMDKPLFLPSGLQLNRATATNAQLRAAGDWVELSKRQEAANKLAMERHKLAQKQLEETKKQTEALKELKPVQRLR